jgi:3'(2'), 5'-bisphosphate nucleotidase
LNDSNHPDLPALLPGVRQLVAKAGTAILEVYSSGHDVQYKADDSPITRADRAAHEILCAGTATP